MIEWLNENEGRSYPFVNAGRYGIPDEVVVDLVVSGPAEILEGAYLSSLVVRSSLVSLSIGSPNGGFVVFTMAGPEPYRPYGMTPVRDGIGGYVTFGLGLSGDLQLDLRNMSVDPIVVDPGCLRPANDRVVKSVGKYGVRNVDALRGVVNLVVSPNMTLAHAGNVISIGLNDEARREFVAKCDKRAIFNECGAPPIRKINGVGPDEDGKLTLEFNNG